MRVNSVQNKIEIFQDFYFEVNGVKISYNEAVKLFYKMDEETENSFLQYYIDKTDYVLVDSNGDLISPFVSSTGYNLEPDIVVGNAPTGNSNRHRKKDRKTGQYRQVHTWTTNTADFTKNLIEQKYTVLAFAQRNNLDIDPKWAQYSAEEIIAMEENGVNIPQEVLDIAHTIIQSDPATYAQDENSESENSEDDNVEKDSFLELIPKAKDKIEKCNEKNEKISAEIEEILPEATKREKNFEEMMKTQRNSLREYESYVREWKSLKTKMDNGEALSDSEAKRYSDLSKIIGAKEKETGSLELNKTEIARALSEINIEAMLGEKLAEETIEISDELADYVSKTNYTKTKNEITGEIGFLRAIIAMANGKELAKETNQVGLDTKEYTEETVESVGDIANTLEIQDSIASVDENGEVVEPENNSSEEKQQTEETEKQKDKFFYVTDQEVLQYIEEAKTINSELYKQINIALKQIKTAKADDKFALLTDKKVSKLLVEFLKEEERRQKEKEKIEADIKKHQQEIMRKENENERLNIEIVQKEEEIAEAQEKINELEKQKQYNTKSGIVSANNDIDSEIEENENKILTNNELITTKQENIVENNNIISQENDIIQKDNKLIEIIDKESEQAIKDFKANTIKEKETINRLVPEEKAARKINDEYKEKDLPEHNERMDFINRAGINLGIIGSEVVATGTYLVYLGTPLLPNPFTHLFGLELVISGSALIAKGTISIGIGMRACTVSDDESLIEEAENTTNIAAPNINKAITDLTTADNKIILVTNDASANQEDSEDDTEGTSNENVEGNGEGEEETNGTAENSQAGEGPTNNAPEQPTESVQTPEGPKQEPGNAAGEKDVNENIIVAETEAPTTTATSRNSSSKNLPEDEAAEETAKASEKAEKDVKRQKQAQKKQTDEQNRDVKNANKSAKKDAKESKKLEKEEKKDSKQLEKEAKKIQQKINKEEQEMAKLVKESEKAAKRQEILLARYEEVTAENEELAAQEEQKKASAPSQIAQQPQQNQQQNGMVGATNSFGMTDSSQGSSSANAAKMEANNQIITELGGQFTVAGNKITRNRKRILKIEKSVKKDIKTFQKKTKAKTKALKKEKKQEEQKQKRLQKQLAGVGIAENIFSLTSTTGMVLTTVGTSMIDTGVILVTLGEFWIGVPFMWGFGMSLITSGTTVYTNGTSINGVGEILSTIGMYGTLACGVTKATINLANGNLLGGLMAIGQCAISAVTSMTGTSSAANNVFDYASQGLSVVSNTAELVNNIRVVQGKEAIGILSKIGTIAGVASAAAGSVSTLSNLGQSGANTFNKISQVVGVVGSTISSASEIMQEFNLGDEDIASLLQTIGGAASMAGALGQLASSKKSDADAKNKDSNDKTESTNSTDNNRTSNKDNNKKNSRIDKKIDKITQKAMEVEAAKRGMSVEEFKAVAQDALNAQLNTPEDRSNHRPNGVPTGPAAPISPTNPANPSSQNNHTPDSLTHVEEIQSQNQNRQQTLNQNNEENTTIVNEAAQREQKIQNGRDARAAKQAEIDAATSDGTELTDRQKQNMLENGSSVGYANISDEELKVQIESGEITGEDLLQLQAEQQNRNKYKNALDAAAKAEAQNAIDDKQAEIDFAEGNGFKLSDEQKQNMLENGASARMSRFSDEELAMVYEKYKSKYPLAASAIQNEMDRRQAYKDTIAPLNKNNDPSNSNTGTIDNKKGNKFNETMDAVEKAVGVASSLTNLFMDEEDEDPKKKGGAASWILNNDSYFSAIASSNNTHFGGHDQGEDQRRRKFKYAKLYA